MSMYDAHLCKSHCLFSFVQEANADEFEDKEWTFVIEGVSISCLANTFPSCKLTQLNHFLNAMSKKLSLKNISNSFYIFHIYKIAYLLDLCHEALLVLLAV